MVSDYLPNVTTDPSPAFAALADATRRTVFERLLGGPRSVGELARGLPVSRPAVSQHLRVLREANLVVAEARGTRVYYRVDPAGIAALRGYFDRLWPKALAAFQAAVEQEEEEPS